MTLGEFRKITENCPDDMVMDKWNTHYGWTELREVKFENCNGKVILSLY